MLESPGPRSQVPGPGFSSHSQISGSEITDASAQVQSLLAQKMDLDKKIADAKVVKNVPQQVYLTYLMMRRELLAKVNALLTTQYEIAKITPSEIDERFDVLWVPSPKQHYTEQDHHLDQMN
jgi:hypothetical protein